MILLERASTLLRMPSRAVVLAGLCSLLGIGAASADQTQCPELEQRYSAARDLVTVQTNNFLLTAAENGCEPLVRRLLEVGASTMARDREANTPLARAARGGMLPVALLLLDRGAEVNARNLQGSTPLLLAIESNRPRLVEALFEHGADPNLPGRSGISPLAAAAYNGNVEIVDAILARGGDARAADTMGKTPIFMRLPAASRRSSIACWLSASTSTRPTATTSPC